MDAATPLKAIVQKGTRLFTRDTADHDDLVAEAPDVETAGWLGWSISEAHSCPHLVEAADSADPAITAKVELSGRLDDPEFLDLLSVLNDTASILDTEVPPQIQEAIQNYLTTAEFETYRRNVAAGLHSHGFGTGRTGRAG